MHNISEQPTISKLKIQCLRLIHFPVSLNFVRLLFQSFPLPRILHFISSFAVYKWSCKSRTNAIYYHPHIVIYYHSLESIERQTINRKTVNFFAFACSRSLFLWLCFLFLFFLFDLDGEKDNEGGWPTDRPTNQPKKKTVATNTIAFLYFRLIVFLCEHIWNVCTREWVSEWVSELKWVEVSEWARADCMWMYACIFQHMYFISVWFECICAHFLVFLCRIQSNIIIILID